MIARADRHMDIRKLIPWVFFLILLVSSCKSAPRAVLAVRDGKFELRGEPCHYIGVNYFDGFTRMLDSEKAGGMGYKEGFRILEEKQIPFLRFNCGGFYPKDWKLYRENPDEYFRLLDEFVHEAEKRQLGLIPSLFWTFFTIPGLVGEPLSSWGDPESKTHAFMRKYTAEVVGRYKDSPAIWGWEFGNEYGLEADLPAAQKAGLAHWYQPRLGMPDKPGPDDYLTSPMIRTAYREFVKAVRTLDPDRPVFTGDSTPRSSAATLEKTGHWGADLPEMWVKHLIRNNPDPVDTLTIHFYPFHPDAGTGLPGHPLEETLLACLQAGRESKKPVFVGEFGPGETPDLATRKAQFETILDLLVRNQVGLSAAWVFDYAPQPYNSFYPDGENAFMLEAISEANRKLRQTIPPHP